MAFHGFGTATRMLYVLARPNIFSPEYTGGIQKHGALLPHSWIQEARSKVWKVATLGFIKGKTLLRPMDAKRPRHPPPLTPAARQQRATDSNQQVHKPYLTANLAH